MPTVSIIASEVRNDYVLTLASGVDFVLAPNVYAIWANDVTGSYLNTVNNDVRIYGTFDLTALNTGGGTAYVGPDGVLAAANGLRLGFNGSTGFSLLTNDGTITSSAVNAAVYLYWGDNKVINTGTIGGAGGVALGQDRSAGDQLINSGTITGNQGFGVSARGDLTRIDNSGSIEAHSNGVYFAGEYDGVSTYSPVTQYLYNSGHIYGGTYGVTAVNQLSDSTVTLINTGEIAGGVLAIQTSGASDTITNRGLILGDVTLGDANDIFDTRGGTLAGNVFGGAGSDLYLTDDADLSIIETNTPGETDFVRASVSFRLGENLEVLILDGQNDLNGFGNSLANTVQGNAGDNRLAGFLGEDSLFGDAGDDRLTGGAGNDSLDAGDDADLLQGGIGNDIMLGGDGDDRLIGGLGRDTMNGGGDRDSFVFQTVSASVATTSAADLIQGFVRGEDVMDLSGLDANSTNATADDAFAFIGTAASFTAAGQVRYANSGSSTFVYIEVNGDGVADSVIRLSGTLALAVSDFIL